MEMAKIHETAHRLVEAHGNKAELEAARKLAEFEQAGDNEQAAIWRRIRAAVHEMKPAHES